MKLEDLYLNTDLSAIVPTAMSSQPGLIKVDGDPSVYKPDSNVNMRPVTLCAGYAFVDIQSNREYLSRTAIEVFPTDTAIPAETVDSYSALSELFGWAPDAGKD